MEKLLQAKIENGKILWKNPIQLSKLLSGFNDKDVFITVKIAKHNRSLNQNAYYFGVVVEILAELTGYSKSEMHEILKAKFLIDTGIVGNESVTFSRSTTELDTSEFEKYINDIREWASSMLNCYIPLPSEIDV